MVDFSQEKIRAELPEFPWQKRSRFSSEYKLKVDETEMYIENVALGNFFESVTSFLKNPAHVKIASNYVTSDLIGLLRERVDTASAQKTDVRIKPVDFADLICMTVAGEISSRGAKDILRIMYEVGGTPRSIARDQKLFQQSNENELAELAKEIISANPNVVADYKAGKEAALQYLIGQCMKKSKGRANPEIVKSILKGVIASL